MNCFVRCRKNESGASLLEMSLLCTGIAVVAILALTDTGVASNDVLCNTTNTIHRNGSTVFSQYIAVNGTCEYFCGNPFIC